MMMMILVCFETSHSLRPLDHSFQTTSALSLCELASRIPATGSTYVYCHACGLGTYAAVLAAACLTLEYVVSGAAGTLS